MDDMEQRKHNAIKLTLKIVGIAMIIAGVVFTIIGLIDFFNAFASEDMHMPSKTWMLFVGFPTIGIGAGITTFAFRREITTYVKNESVPVINDASEELAPAIENIANAVQNGSDKVRCDCGELNEEGDNFCKSCGKPLYKTCPSCGKKIESQDSKFCPSCGKRLDE